jgi:hypothetical protein
MFGRKQKQRVVVQSATPRAVRPEHIAKPQYDANNKRNAVQLGCIPLL